MSVKRPSMHKQQSLSASDDPSVYVSPKLLERRGTVTLPRSESRHGSSPFKDRPQTSPLKRFAQAKESISRVFTRIYEQLEEVKSFLASVPGVAHKSDEVCGLLERADGINSVLARDHMKVAFFGRTSNGKSTVINALLHDKVLPSGIGHTTNCFCSVVGCYEEEGYLLTPGSSQPQNVKNVQQLAHAVHMEESSGTSELIQIHWPMSRCALLKDDVVLMDSPGIDMNPNIDDWIDRHCTDADVFVLVSNAESTLMTTEKSFFHRVSQKLSKPNIFILNNRWDASAQEPDMMEQIRKQHLERAITFLTEELGVVDRDVAKDRVFFISAKEVLQLRMKESKLSSPIPNEVMAEGYQSRFLEFQRFESKFKACLSSSAIQTKFEQHYKRATDIIKQLEVLLTEAEHECAASCQQLALDLQRCKEHQQKLYDNAQRITEGSRNVVSGMAKAVDRKVTMVLDNVTSQLSNLVDSCEVNFDQHNLSVYKESLYGVVDNNIIEQIRQKCSLELQKLHNTGLQSIADGFQEALQMPEKQLSNFVYKVTKPELRDLTNCDQLCEGFKEDLSFHSSLSPSSLLRIAQHFNIDVVAVVMGSGGVSNFLPLIGIAGSLLVLIRYVSWPVIGTGVLCYGLFYCWERLRWTDGAQRSCFNQQFVEYLQSKLKQQISVTGHSHTRIIESNLANHIDRLSQEVELTQLQEGERIRNLTQEQKKLLGLQERVRWLRNASHLLHSDLSDFQAAYLMDQQLD